MGKTETTPCYHLNCSHYDLAPPFWNIRAEQLFTTQLSAWSTCYTDFPFANREEGHTRRQLWANQEMGWKEVRFILQCLFRKIHTPFHLIHCCLKSWAEKTKYMFSGDLWSFTRNGIQLYGATVSDWVVLGTGEKPAHWPRAAVHRAEIRVKSC